MRQTHPADGQSQWELIGRQVLRRPMAVISGAVIFLLIQASIWAPFLANDRPLYYFGVNRFEYRESLRTCQGALIQLIAHRKKPTNDPVPYSVKKALGNHLPLLSKAMAPADAQRLAAWKVQVDEAQSEPNSGIAIEQLQQLRKSLTAGFSEDKVELQSASRWPVLVSLNWLEVLFLAWSLMTLFFPLWRLLLPGKAVRSRRHLVAWTLWIGIPLVAAAAWWRFVPQREDITNYKQGQFASDVGKSTGKSPVVYQGVIWPPIPYGLAESILEQKYREPPWYPQKRTAEDTAQSPAKHAASPWNGPHWLGTDSLGRDALSRMIWGGRVSLSVGVVSVSIYVTLGIILGALAGYFRGIVDLIISRIIEVVICFPTFFLILTIVALRGPSIFNIMIIIGLTGWTGIARLIRAEFLRLVDQEFVLAGRAIGYSPARLIFRHILPNAMAPVLVSATFGVAGAILTESALSFLGLGITIPIPSWGGIMSDGRKAEGAAQWLILLPGLAIFLTITCYNLVGEALRDASDPRLRGSRT